MRLRLTVMLICSAFLAGSMSIGFNLAAQPNQFNISNIEPNTLYPGTVFAVNGGQYIDNNSQIYFGQGSALETYFESANQLVAIVPLDSNFCGEQGIIVKTEVNINNSPAQIDSNFVVKEIQCENPNNLTPATPTISDVTQLDLISGRAAIRIEGRNLIPSAESNLFSVNNQYPYTEVRVYNSEYEYTGRGQYQSFGEMEYEFPEDVYCGEYQVELTNHFSGSQVSNNNVPSSASIVQINEYCQGGNGNGIAGGYEVMNLDLPSTAYVDEQIQGSVQVRNLSGDTFYGRYVGSELELYVNGELQDTRELNLDPEETQTFPLSFNFDRIGEYEIEIRVDGSYQQATIDVQSQNGTGPPPTQGATELYEYDMDGDCTMSDTEFFVATDAWISESISDLLFFSAVDAWIGQTNICPVSTSTSSALQLMQTTRGILFSLAQGDQLGAVSVYDASGREVYSQTAPSNRLFWNMRDKSNQPVANGVYFVHIGTSHEIRPIVVVQ